jgi:hypothetical protein
MFLLKHPLYTADLDIAHHIIRAYREPLMVPAAEHFRLDFVELPKLLLPGPGQPGQRGHQAQPDRLHLWAEFFMRATQPDASEGLMSDPIIKKTFDKLKEISAMDEAQQIARARELGMLRVSMELDEARDEGLQKGREEGRQEGRKEGREEGRVLGLQQGRDEGARRAQAVLVRKLMDGGMSLDQIAAVIKMTEEELEFLLASDQD